MKMKSMILALVASTAMTGAALAGGGYGGGGGTNYLLAPGSFVAGDMSNSNEMTGIGVIVNQQSLLGNVNYEELEMENESNPIDLDDLDAILGAAGYVGGDVKQTGIFFVDGDIEEDVKLNIVGGDNGDYAFGDNESIGGDYLESLADKAGGDILAPDAVKAGGDYLEAFADKAGGDILAPLAMKGNDFSDNTTTTTATATTTTTTTTTTTNTTDDHSTDNSIGGDKNEAECSGSGSEICSENDSGLF